MTDLGTAYELPPPAHDAELTEVRRGTPMGELPRRYWHPVPIPHGAFSGMRFTNAMAAMPSVTFETTDIGVKVVSGRPAENGQIFKRVAEGRDPVGVSFDPNAPLVVFEASNRIQMNTPPMPPAG